MKKVMSYLCLIVILSFCIIQSAQASEEFDSALLRLLIKKGVITQQEAEDLKVEVQRQAGREPQPVTIMSAQPVKGIKLGGKLEIRYEDSEGEEN